MPGNCSHLARVWQTSFFDQKLAQIGPVAGEKTKKRLHTWWFRRIGRCLTDLCSHPCTVLGLRCKGTRVDDRKKVVSRNQRFFRSLFARGGYTTLLACGAHRARPGVAHHVAFVPLVGICSIGQLPGLDGRSETKPLRLASRPIGWSKSRREQTHPAKSSPHFFPHPKSSAKIGLLYDDTHQTLWPNFGRWDSSLPYYYSNIFPFREFASKMLTLSTRVGTKWGENLW